MTLPGIHKASEISRPNVCALLYGAPGSGKTSVIGELPGKTLLIDIDHSSDVLRDSPNAEGIDIIRIDPELRELKGIVRALEEGNGLGYDTIVIDNLTELQQNMLNFLAKSGKNGITPELQHYNQVNYILLDYVRRFRALPGDTIITAWEDVSQVTTPSGEQYTQFVPSLREKIRNEVCGLCNVVGHVEISPEEDNQTRIIRLTSSRNVYAKDQVYKRKWCETRDLLGGKNS